MTAPGEQPAATRWLGIALLLSLAINAFIVGTIATRILEIRDFRRPNPPPVVDALADSNRMLRGIPKDRRDQLRLIVRGHQLKMKPHREALDEARNALADAVAADPLDLARVDAALVAIQQVRAGMRDSGRNLTLDLVKAMTPAERQELAQRMDRRKRTRTSAR